MKRNIIGSVIIIAFIAFLGLFPFLGHLWGDQIHVIRTEISQIEPWFLKEEKSKVVLIYFGYVGCTSICIPTMNQFAPMYQEILRKGEKVPLYFVNLNPNQPKEWVEPFAKSFHPDFKGIWASWDQTYKLEHDFNLAMSGEEEISHSSNLYLMVREESGYVLRRIYTTHPYPADLILDDIVRFGR